MRDIAKTSPGVRIRTSEYLEYGWDIRSVGPTGDMIHTDNKGDLFMRMKTAYVEKKSRLAPLLGVISRHEINWQGDGV